MAGETLTLTQPIPIEEEIDGDRDGTSDFVFVRIGESLPLKPSDSAFDPANPPSRPLAISERHGVLFLVHSQGFFVAKSKDVIGAAKEIKEKEKGPSVEGASVVDVRIGRVSILALSGDESTLAATVGAELYFFSIPKLLDKEQEPLFSCTVNDSCTIRDFKWQKESKKFLLLSSHGSLSHGSMGAQLKDVLDNVDAADWSIEGDFVAIARKNTLSILSSNFEEQHSMALLFQSWTDPDSGCTIKVDSIKWVREDSIIIGCLRMNEDGNEEGYLVQVITSREHKLSEVPCKPVVYSFPDIFDGIMDDILPTGGGPYLLTSYLDCWELVLASNQKVIDQHVLLLKWSVDEDGRVVFLEFSNDKYTPRIDLQENGDDNIILGFCVDKFSVYEKITIKVDSDVKELSPRCVLLCLTIEGKLILYHAARLSEPSDMHQTSLSPDDHSFVKEKPFTLSSVELIKATSTLTDYVEGAPSDNKLKQISNVEPGTRKDQSEVLREKTAGKNREADGSQLGLFMGQVPTFNKSSPESPFLRVSGSVIRSEVKAGPQTAKSFTALDLSANSSACSTTSVEAAVRNATNERTIETGEVGKGVRKSSDTTGSTFGMQSTTGVLNSTGTTEATFGMQSTRKIFGGDGFTANHAVIASSRPVLNVAQHGSISNQFQSSGQLFNAKGSNRDQLPSTLSSNKAPVNEHSVIASSGSALNVAQQSSFSTQFQSSGQLSHANRPDKDQPSFMFSSNKAPQYEEHTGSLPRPGNVVHTIRDSPSLAQQGSLLSKSHHPVVAQPLLENIRASSLPQMLDSEPKLSKQFYDVKDMAKELDTLLSFIEREGGFRDVCTNFQKSSLFSLENGLEHLSQISRKCKKKTEEQLLEIQQLQNKKLQVSARQIYMKGVVEQASNEKYRDIWNQQKLSPEFEVKWQHILNLHQNLTNQLIELERHFNNLELNRFGESGRVPKGRKSYQNSLQPSRQIQSFHSVYNTLNSQLAAAEHLSECLSTQMSMLNISSPPVKKQNVAKELLESIGLPHDAIMFQSPDCKRMALTPNSIKRTSTSDEYQRRNTASAFKSFEPETARRRRDSLGRSWASFEPSKTTVKRIVQEERIRVGADKPFSKAKEAYDSQLEAFAIRQKNNATPAYFSSGSSLNEDVEESSINQVSESRSNSVFRWAKDASDFSQTQGSNSRRMQIAQKTTSHLSSSVVPSPSVFSSSQSNRKMLFTSPDHTGFGSTQLGIQSNPFDAKSSASASTLTSSMLPSSMPPMMTRSTVEAKGQASKNLNLKMDGSAVFSTSSTLPLAASLSRTPFGNLSASTKGAEASNLIAPTFASADSSQAPLSSSIKFSQSQKSLHSTTARTSTSTSLPSITSGGPTLGSKPVGQTNQVASVSTSSTSGFSLSSTSSLQSSQSQKLLFPTSLSLTSSSESPTSLSNAANSRTEQSSPVPPASESAKSEPVTPQAPAINDVAVTRKESNLSPTNTGSISFATLGFQPEIPSTGTPTLGATTTAKDGGLDAALSQEDEMEEEASDTTTSLSLGTFGGFGLGSTPSSAPKSNPFGGSFLTSSPTMSTPTALQASPGETFRPASFSLPSAQPAQAPQPVNPVAFSSGLGGGYSGFGQPAQLGVGQQALGSVLGAFGQSRQLGAGMPGVGVSSGLSPPPNVGGFASASAFSSAVAGGGFTSVASAGGGFAGGGFASVPSFGGGFAGAATGGGFAGAATGGGFAGAATGGGFGSASGGFGAFSSNQVGGFSTFGAGAGAGNPGAGAGAGAGAGKPPAELLTQMRK